MTFLCEKISKDVRLNIDRILFNDNAISLKTLRISHPLESNTEMESFHLNKMHSYALVDITFNWK